ncbi:endonuclease III [Stenomitos frigidus]|uniref:Endonuclease III n=1 Tax=Stenomitos frigidus ULC18 TaxID=2107698 RepID=A0A2T1EDC4_9CYAN|nr:endonuclease III [Stenomitos frigidus]PSB30695.1 endonuclease III [Stenomitos frigidus ULC18]
MCASRKLPAKQQRAIEILLRLKRLYPDATCSLDYETPMQLLVATILSAQCTDVRVNMVTPELFRRFPDAAAMAGADLDEIETLVKSTGFYRNKAKNIQAACRMIMTEFGGDVPQVMEDLLKLPGVARKTANVVLANAFGINMGVTVDTHVKRLSFRLGLTKHTDPVRVERDLMKLLPQPDWENWSIRLIYHGRAVCMARNPQCDRCAFADICPSATLSQKPLATPEPDDLAITPEHPQPASVEKSGV